MKALVLYDSTFGNTEKIARAIGETIRCPVLRAGDFNPEEHKDVDLLIVGSPTHGGRPTPDVHRLLGGPLALQGVDAAAFDTRTERFSRIFGYAAARIGQSLERGGGKLLVPPEGFVVIKNKGPLKEGELARAAGWAQLIMKHRKGKHQP
ncbi:MAG: flavodoxin family protein [Anaerolineales bacterium]